MACETEAFVKQELIDDEVQDSFKVAARLRLELDGAKESWSERLTPSNLDPLTAECDQCDVEARLTANVNAALARFDALAAQPDCNKPAQTQTPIVVLVNSSKPTCRPVEKQIEQKKESENESEIDDDLTNLSWLQNTNLLQQLQTAANERGPQLLSPSESECDSESDCDHCVWSPARPTCHLLFDADLQASQFVTVGEESCNPDWQDANGELSDAIYERPPYSLNSLIFMAIESSALKCLPVREIYEWITRQFPYYRRAPAGWKNSIRHTLSLGRCFKRFIADLKTPGESDSGCGKPWSHVANASGNAKTHLNAFAKGALWMVDADQRPALIQGLHRTLWELRHSRNQRPSNHLAPLLTSSLLGYHDTNTNTFRGNDSVDGPVSLTNTPFKSETDSSDADMNAVHALVALKSATQHNLVANLLSEAVSTRTLDTRVVRGRAKRAHDTCTPHPQDHDYLQFSASPADTINVTSVGLDGSFHDQVMLSNALCAQTADLASLPRKRAARKAQLEFRAIGDAQCAVASDCALASSAAFKHRKRRKLSSSFVELDQHCDCCKCSRRQLHWRHTDKKRRKLERFQIAEDANQNEQSSKAHKKHRSVVNSSWKEYKRILSRRRTKHANVRLNSKAHVNVNVNVSVNDSQTVRRLPVAFDEDKNESTDDCGRPHTMVTRSRSGRGVRVHWRTRTSLADGTSHVLLPAKSDLKKTSACDL